MHNNSSSLCDVFHKTMKLSTWLFVSTILILLFVFGCTTKYGNPIDESYVLNEIVKGKTTKDEIQRKFGHPNNTSITSDGEIGWIYPYYVQKNYPFNRHWKNTTLRITFENNVVKNYIIMTDQSK